MQINALILGLATSAECDPIGRLVDALASSVQRRSRIDDLQTAIDDDWFPDLVIVLQHWSDEYAAQDIATALARFPLARWVCCYGTWCESDGRNRPDAWPTAIRVPMRRACARLQQEARVLTGQASPIPLTAARDEVFAFDFDHAPTASLAERRVLVSSPDRALHTMLSDVARTYGAKLLLPGDGIPDIILCDADPWTHRQDVLSE
ncbi:MAG: hypothetical protein O3A00_06975, partial [Planctomycetota bacterium]|nr:hypothetical protein [Planctomycetota bacterium]